MRWKIPDLKLQISNKSKNSNDEMTQAKALLAERAQTITRF